jgi:hypothetical protein
MNALIAEAADAALHRALGAVARWQWWTPEHQRRLRNLQNRERRYLRDLAGNRNPANQLFQWQQYCLRQQENLLTFGNEWVEGDQVPPGYRQATAIAPRAVPAALRPLPLVDAQPDLLRFEPLPPLPPAQGELRRVVVRNPPAPAPQPILLPPHLAKNYFNLAQKCGEVPDCPICLDVVSEETIVITPCGHIFCRGCLTTAMAAPGWAGGAGGRQRCPQCRAMP